MQTAEPTSNAPVASTPRWVKRFKIGLAVIAAVGLACLIYQVIQPGLPAKLVWVAGPPIPRPKQQGTWSKVRYEIIKFTYPVWRKFRKNPLTVRVECSLVRVPAGMSLPAQIGPPDSTSTDGFSGWIVTAEELAEFRNAFTTNPGASLLTSSSLITRSGSPAQVSTLDKSTKNFTVNLSPKVTGKSIRLGIGGQWIWESDRTNGVACRVLLPNGGVLILGGNEGDKNGTRDLLIINAAAVDAKGNPLKL